MTDIYDIPLDDVKKFLLINKIKIPNLENAIYDRAFELMTNKNTIFQPNSILEWSIAYNALGRKVIIHDYTVAQTKRFYDAELQRLERILDMETIDHNHIINILKYMHKIKEDMKFEEYWNYIGNKLILLESLHNHIVKTSLYLSNHYQGIPKYNIDLEIILDDNSDIYLSAEYYLINKPWTKATLSSLHSLNLQPYQWKEIENSVTIEYYEFFETLNHINGFIKIIMGDRSENLDYGRFELDPIYDRYQFEKALDLYLNWLKLILEKYNVKYIPLEHSPISSYWVKIGTKLKQLKLIYNNTLNTCKGLEKYNLNPLIITRRYGLSDYSLEETLINVGYFLREINGEVFDGDDRELYVDSGMLMTIYDPEYINENIDDLNGLNDEEIKNKVKHEAGDYLDLYINYLLNVSRQCQKTTQIITNAQEKFLERRYHPSGELAKQAANRFYNPNK